MVDPEIYDPQELGRRQQMAAARRQRESKRLALLAQLVDAQRRSDELKRWISAYTRPAGDEVHPELGRMVAWAASQLDDLERILDPQRIGTTLQERALFPDVDPLDDPKGEPPDQHIWGHSAALRHINVV
ncbi:hypothetical protein LJR030_002683 [Rhizobium sp. LjRoot30]|uniref:hypothetical protein n=1 Tax=Rhizobium sp. LjRoot30 TaxID=3342320 RepID=UPI003ECEEC2A